MATYEGARVRVTGTVTVVLRPGVMVLQEDGSRALAVTIGASLRPRRGDAVELRGKVRQLDCVAIARYYDLDRRVLKRLFGGREIAMIEVSEPDDPYSGSTTDPVR